MSSINGQERKALREALVEAFQSFEALRRMGLDQLDFDLNSRTHAGLGTQNGADELIREMDEKEGRAGIVRLIEAARAERPNNPALREAERTIMRTTDPLGDVHSTPAVAGQIATRVGLERVIVEAAGFPRFDDVISRLGPAEYRVCLVSYQLPDGRTVYGTAFLVANDLVMTNDHVIKLAREKVLPGSAIELAFGYRSKEAHARRYKLVAQDWLVTSDGTLDYAILRVEGAPGSDTLITNGTTERGYFKLVTETPQPNLPLIILQHPYDKLDESPAALRMTIGFAHAPEDGQPAHVLRHSANTSEGSSGSPVFTGKIDLIALHNWGGPKHNEAILCGAIKKHLASTGHDALLG